MLALNQPPSWSSIELASTEPAAPESDINYEDELIALLGRLDYSREAMVAASAGCRVSQLLTSAQDFMTDLAAFSDRHCGYLTNREIAEAHKRAKEFAAGLATLREQAPPAAGKLTQGIGGGKNTASPVDQELARRAFAAFHDAVCNYFVAFTGRFPDSLSARPWVEVAATFLAELKRLTQNPVEGD